MALPPLPFDLDEAENLPSPPGVVLEILRLANDPTKSAHDLGVILQQDPVLAAKLLKIVNSAAYGLSGPVDDISRAVTILGFRPVRLLAMACSASDTFSTSTFPPEFDIMGFWTSSVITATGSRLIASRWNRQLGETAFVTGLLSRLGRLVLIRCVPDLYVQVLRHNPHPTPEDELTMMGFTSAVVGATLLEKWGLPRRVVLAVAYQHNPAVDLPPEDDEHDDLGPPLMRSVAFSSVVGEVTTGNDAEAGKVFDCAHRWLGLEPPRTVELLEQMQREVAEVGSLVIGGLPPGMTPDQIMTEARSTIARLMAANRSRQGVGMKAMAELR